MANPFKEADKAKKKPAGNLKPAGEKREEVVEVPAAVEEKIETPVVEAPAEVVVEQPKTEKKAPEVKKTKEEKPAVAKTKANILAGLNADKDAAHTHAFYLTDKNVEKLKAVAEKQGVSASKLLDHILSEFL